ncbi:MAG: SRPBCC domain-containing protein [Cyclobacteriaceae bacterium]|nr:SRPBCC domain-containing protein [Cyclobacteriaceae bacterium]
MSPVDEGTKLTITQSNYDQEKANHSAANWARVIDGLKQIVE